jgi:ECF transporter S component (folate family)
MPHPLPHTKIFYLSITLSLLWRLCHSKRKEVLFLISRVTKISLAGLFVATSIILARFFAGDIIIGGLSVLRISFGTVPIYLSGIILGPVYGAFTGILADILGYFLKPLGPYFPGFTVNGALSGLIPGLLASFYNQKKSWWRLLLIVALAETVTSVMLTPLWLNMITGKAFIAFLPSNLLSRVFLIPLHVTLVKLILKYSSRAIPSLR